jgi:hypothetical protein
METIGAKLGKFLNRRRKEILPSYGEEAVAWIKDRIAIDKDASQPGSFPHSMGPLIAGVSAEVKEESVRIVSAHKNGPIPVYLNYGTSTMAPRPYMFEAAEHSDEIMVKALK